VDPQCPIVKLYIIIIKHTKVKKLRNRGREKKKNQIGYKTKAIINTIYKIK